jgi:ribosome-associated toxin RatA of RatAB toxin-antitoxin module
MKRISRQAEVPYSAGQMYDLVSNIDAYGDFLPWCGGSEVLSGDEDEVVAAIRICYGGLDKSFKTRNRVQKNKMMEMRLLEGPFRHLYGYWRFVPLEDGRSRVHLDLEFEFASRLVGLAAAPVFTRIADGMVDAFVQRAADVYGRKT